MSKYEIVTIELNGVERGSRVFESAAAAFAAYIAEVQRRIVDVTFFGTSFTDDQRDPYSTHTFLSGFTMFADATRLVIRQLQESKNDSALKAEAVESAQAATNSKAVAFESVNRVNNKPLSPEDTNTQE